MCRDCRASGRADPKSGAFRELAGKASSIHRSGRFGPFRLVCLAPGSVAQLVGIAPTLFVSSALTFDPMQRSTCSLVILALSAALGAQSFTIVNPQANATTEGSTRISFPWGQGASDMRYQQICSLSVIANATGLLKQIAHRRDNDTIVSSGNYTAWNPDLTLSVSTSPFSASEMSPVFANNHGADLKQVFSGTLKWPAEAKMAPGPTKFVYAIPFQQSFLYLGNNGDLCYDVQRLSSGPNNNSLFFMDAASGAVGSPSQRVSVIGTGCSNPAGNNDVYFYNGFVPGSNYARLLLYNAANNSPAWWSVGNVANPGLDLAFLGAPGCKLYHNNLIIVAGMTSNSATAYKGRWQQVLSIPNNPAFNGATFLSQFALINDQHIGNAANFSVSDAHSVTLGTFKVGAPAHTEAHASGLAPANAALVQHGYGMITEFTF